MTEKLPLEDDVTPQHAASIPLLDEHEPVQKSAKKGSGLGLLLWFILLLIVAAGGFYGWQQLQTLQARLAKNEQMLKQIPALQQNLINQFQTSTQNTAQQMQLLQSNIARLNNLVTGNENDWQLIETWHLLQLASLSLDFEKNIPATLSLLQLANQRLYLISDPNLNTVRQLLVNDITSLRAIKPVDVSGIYMQLQSLRTQVLQMPLVNKQYHSNAQRNLLAQQVTNSTSYWGKTVNILGQALSQVLIIRHRTAPLEPLLAPDQEVILKQNLYWLFEQAQWAVLHQQPQVYQSSLQQLSQLITQYFQLNTQVNIVLQTLTQLQQIDINPALPNLNNLLDELDKYKKQHQDKLLATPTPTTTNTSNQPDTTAPGEPVVQSTKPNAIPAPTPADPAQDKGQLTAMDKLINQNGKSIEV